MSKRLIGFGYTNANGVATLDYDAEGNELQNSGYVGQGVGNVDISASAVIDGSTFVSGTFSVFDCYRHDDGTINSHNDIWTGITNTDLTREAEYTTIKEKTVGTTALITFGGVPFKNYRIECDVYQVDGTQDEWFITVLKEDYTAITSADAKLGEWKHIILDLTDIAPNSRVRLNTGGSCTELRFKNFMLYPYGDNDVISINASNPVITNLDTTNITGSLFIEGELQKNTNIDVYKNGTKVDTISTGSNGVASYTYTGSGAGATEFQFKYGNILSQIFVVIDGTFFDKGTSENTKWNGALQRSYSSDGTTVTATANWQVLYCGNPTITFNSPFAIEFEITALTDTPAIRFYGANNVSSPFSFNTNHIGHWKFEFLSDSIKTYKDGTEVQNWLSSLIGLNLSVAWQFSDTTDGLTFKNFVVYPI